MRRNTCLLFSLVLCSCIATALQDVDLPDAALLHDARARFALFKPEDNEAAIALFRQAIDVRPTAEAYAGLAEALAQKFFWNQTDTATFEETLAIAAKAIELDPRSAQAHFARAYVLGVANRPVEASRAYLRTLELDPDYPRAARLALGRFWRAGLYDEAYRWGSRTLEKEPQSLGVIFDFAVANGFLLEKERARELWHRALEINPKYGLAYGELAFLASAENNADDAVKFMEMAVAVDPRELNSGGLGHMLIMAGRPHRAIEVLEPLLAKNRSARAYGGRSVLSLYGWALRDAGDREKADQIFDEALALLARRERNGETTYQLYRERALIHSLRGHREEALAAATMAVAAGWHLYGSAEASDPTIDLLRGDPRFDRLLAQMKADIDPMRARVGLPPLSR